MNHPDQLWRLTDVAVETDGDIVWVAPLRNGPIVRLQGVASVLLEHFREPSRISDAVGACVTLFDDAPDDAHTQLEQQAEDFVSIGLLTPAVAAQSTASH